MIPADDQSMPGIPAPAVEPESRAARRSAELGGTLRPRRIPDQTSAWAPPPAEPGPAADVPIAPVPAAPVGAAPVPPGAAPGEIERYYLCCEVPSGDFVEVILAVSDGGRRRYFTTSDGDRLAEVDEYYFVRRSLGDARSMLELDAREMAELEAELNFARPLRGRDPLAELAAGELDPVSETTPETAVDATEPSTPAVLLEAVVVDEHEAEAETDVEPPSADETAPIEPLPAPAEVADPDAEAWAELLRRAGFEAPELTLAAAESEPVVEPVPVVEPAPVAHPEALMVEPVLMQWAETIDSPSPAPPESEAQPDPEPIPEPVAEPAGPALPAPPKLTLVPEPPVVAPETATPRLTLVPGPPSDQTSTPAPVLPPFAEPTPEDAPAPGAAPTSDSDSNEETNPVAMMTNPTDALAPAASVTPISAPAALHSAPAPAIDADAAAQVALAKGIAFVAHRGQVDQVGADYIDHPGRVAEHFDPATEPVATAAAWLHDVVERSAVSEQELFEAGVRPDIVEIVVLLTRTAGMSDDEYFARIRSNPLARRVKLADVADNSAPWRLRKLDYDAQQRLAAKYRHAREALG